jgi:acetyltransferase-like isoleucine patch superfamily enzyme
MIKSLLRKLAYKIYEIGEFEASKRIAYQRKEELKNKAIISDDSNVSEAIFHNNQNNQKKIRIGSNCFIKGELLIFKHGGEILIGDHCFIGEGSRIWSAKKIVVGNRVLISHNVNILDNISHPLNAQLRHEDYLHILSKGLQESVDLREAEVIIEDDAWIGFNSIILKGVRIGKGAIVGAGTIVTKDVPDFAVVVGNTSQRYVS